MSGPSIDEILEDYRHAGVGGHLVGGGVLRALCAEIDRLRDASPTIACECGRKIHVPGAAERDGR